MITEDEFNLAYNILADSLATSGFQWVIDQIASDLENGKLVSEQVQSVKPIDLRIHQITSPLTRGDKGLRVSGQAERIVQVDFSPEEKLRIFLDGLEQISIHALEMEMALSTLIEVVDAESEIRLPENRIVFISNSDPTQRTEFTPSGAREKQELLERLRTLIHQIRRAL